MNIKTEIFWAIQFEDGGLFIRPSIVNKFKPGLWDSELLAKQNAEEMYPDLEWKIIPVKTTMEYESPTINAD